MIVGSCPPPFPPKKVLTAQFWHEMLMTAGWAILPDVGAPPKDLEARSGPNLGLLWQLFPVRFEEMENKHCKTAFENYTNFANRGKTENGAQYPQILLERCPDAPEGRTMHRQIAYLWRALWSVWSFLRLRRWFAAPSEDPGASQMAQR